MKIVYMGTGDIGLAAVRALIDHPDHTLVGVFTQPDRPVGRHQTLTPPAVKEVVAAHGIPVFQPEKIRDPAAVGALRELAPHVVVVMAYGQILPSEIINTPSIACLNLHASLLPKFRGAAPIQAAIREGESETGITVIYIDEGLDTGDILLSEKIDIAPEETGESLHARLADLAPLALARSLEALQKKPAPRRPQDHEHATHSPKLVRADGHVLWDEPADRIERTIRAFHPWPGTFTRFTSPGRDHPTNLKIFPPTTLESSGAPSSPPGTLLEAGDAGITVSTATTPLRITDLQPEGRKRMPAAEFLRGTPLPPGTRFS